MPKHPTAHRAHRSRRKDEEPEDAFVARMMEIGMWAKRHMNLLLIVGAVAVVAVALTVYYVNYQGTVRSQATARLAELRQTVQSGNNPLAIRDLESFIGRFGSTPSANEARLMLASVQLQEGQPEAAAETVRRLASDLDAPVGTNAAFLLAAAQEQQNNLDQAVATYLRIADGARFTFERRRALENAARARMQNGENAGAVDLLERIVNGMPANDPERNYYQMLLAEARAAAQTPQSS